MLEDTASLQESAEAIVLLEERRKGRTWNREREAMSSTERRGKQKTLDGGCPEREAVNPPKAKGVPSLSTARVAESPHETADLLMERVVEKENMERALNRAERNQGAAGMDGMEVRELRSHLRKNWGRQASEEEDAGIFLLEARRGDSPATGSGDRKEAQRQDSSTYRTSMGDQHGRENKVPKRLPHSTTT